MNELAEFKIFMNDLPPLARNFDWLYQANSKLNKKDAAWTDLLELGLAAFCFGAQAVKTYNDGKKLYEAVTEPKPGLVPIDARFYFPVHNRSLALLNNQILRLKGSSNSN